MKGFKAAAIILSALILLCGCRARDENTSSFSEITGTASSSSVGRGYLTLLYSSADTFNPYTAATDINRQLCRLLYEPLLKTDNSYNISYSLAQSAEVKGKECTVSLKSRYFSDGTALTAEDVVYSFNLAKKSNTEYAYKLYEALSAAARDSKTVVIKLDRADPYFANVLDFPIIKRNSDKITDSDGVTHPPIGCGRFKLNENSDRLVVNEHDPGKNRAIGEIRLINAPDSEAVGHYVEIGAADMYYSDISDGNILRMSGKKVNINLNHLIYMGVNLSNEQLSLNALRQAISSGLDRKEICRDGYYNNALPANGFFNPAWEAVKSVQNINLQANKEITVENLEEIGYNKLDSAGVRTNGAGKKLYESLETILRDMGIVNLYARIACPQGQDPYLSEDSLHFHEHMGFAQEGLFRNCAYKFGRWYALSCMVKSIAPHLPQQPPVTPYPQLLPKDTIQ